MTLSQYPRCARLLAPPFLVAFLVLLTVAARAAEPVDYLKDIKPVLAAHCYNCHGASQQKAGLRLDTATLALTGGRTGPALKPGDSAASLLVQAISGTHAELPRMPFKNPVLSDTQIALLKNWIDQGAKAPASESPETSKHWAFNAPQRPAISVVAQTKWPRTAIDHFILARLEKEKITPSPEADRVTLIRRLSLDLIGLPPSPAEVDAFVADRAPDAYTRLVERLLDSPHYGERWGRWWLDVARYADSNGYSIDAPRQIWKYRDWVIHALNKDLPFDQFAVEQLAGDMLPNATLDQKIATGFHRNTQINQEGGIDKEQFRIESVIDRVSTTGTAFLGLTVGCAQCHDHKFDPITQKEFYRLFAFLNNAEEPELAIATPEEIAHEKESNSKVAAYLAALPGKDPTIYPRMVKWEVSLSPTQRQALSQAIREAFDNPFEKRTDAQKQLELAAFIEQAPENKAHSAALKKLQKAKSSFPTTLVLREMPKPRRTYLFIKGDFTRDGGPVGPGVPAILHPLTAGETTNRLDFARWIVSPQNPLLARVTVNRVWQQYFGRGLVETENDFGTQGLAPTHPELLDWLATEFMNPTEKVEGLKGSRVKAGVEELKGSRVEALKGSTGKDAPAPASTLQPFNPSTPPVSTPPAWSLKHLHRLIAHSATYRTSSKARPDLAITDPNNKLLSHQNRLRLDAEAVRDTALTASGLLSPKLGGPSVFPPIPDGVMSLGQVRREWKVSTGEDRYRRGLYTFFFRATPPPALNVFDAPDGFSTCTRRIRSNTPLQALTLLNDAAFHEFAEALAARVLKDGPPENSPRLDYAFRLCVARAPSATEHARLESLLQQQLADTQPKAAWTTVARVLLNLDETITRE